MRTVLDLISVTPLCFSEHLHQMSPSPSFLVRRGLRRAAGTHTHTRNPLGAAAELLQPAQALLAVPLS